MIFANNSLYSGARLEALTFYRYVVMVRVIDLYAS